jgi:hypothetical protein
MVYLSPQLLEYVISIYQSQSVQVKEHHGITGIVIVIIIMVMKYSSGGVECEICRQLVIQ